MMGENTMLTKVRNRRSSMAAMIMKLERTVFLRSFTEYQAIAKVLLLLTLASLPGSVQQSPAFGGLGNLSPFADYIGFYLGAMASPSVLSGLLNGSLLLALTSWSVASMFMFCLATSIREMVELDLISPRGPSAYRLQWLHSLRYLLASIFYPPRMRPCKTALEFLNYFGVTRIRQSRLAVDSISGTRTIPDRSSCLSLTRRAVMNSFGYDGINAAVLQEKQIRKALSSIGTGFRKQISVRCPVSSTRNMDTNSLTSQFEDLLRTRRLNDLADRSQRRKKSSELLFHASLSTRSLSRQVSSHTEQSNSLPAYSALRNNPRIASPPQDPASLRFCSKLQSLSLRPTEYEKPPERNRHTITAGHSESCSGLVSLFKTISLLALEAPSQDHCRERRRYLPSNKLQPDTILKPESMGTASRTCSSRDKKVTFAPLQKYGMGWDPYEVLKIEKSRARCQGLYPAVYSQTGSLRRALTKGSVQRSRYTDCESSHCCWNPIEHLRKDSFDRHINSFHGDHGKSPLDVWSLGCVLTEVAKYLVNYNATAPLRRVHFEPKRKNSKRLKKSADDRRGHEENERSYHIKEGIHELDDVIQPPLDTSPSLMDDPAPIAIVGLPAILPGAGSPDRLWDMLSQISNVDSRLPESRFNMSNPHYSPGPRAKCPRKTVDFGLPSFNVMPKPLCSSALVQAVYDLGGYWPFTRYNVNMDASGQADLLQQKLTMLAYDAQPLPPNILGVLTEFDYRLRDVLDLLASHSKTIDRYSRLDLDHEVSSNSLRIIFQAGGILWSEAFIVLGISFEV